MLTCIEVANSQQMIRNLDHYETLPPVELPLTLDWNTRRTMEGKIRQFLWDHWHLHRLGHANVVAFSKEGDVSRTSYFIEPDTSGIWRVVVNIERDLVARPGSKSKRVTTNFDAYSLERIQFESGDDSSKEHILSTDVVCSGELYRLGFKNKAGKLLTRM